MQSRGIFITGATGNVGSRLVAEYLKHPYYKLFLLVRGKSQQNAEARISKALEFWDVPASTVRDRVVVLTGDVCQDKLGLSGQQIEDLKQVHLVIHGAANIRLNLSLQDARDEILEPTKRVLDLSMACPRLERFGFLSTIEVAGNYDRVVHEEFLTDYKRDFLNTYEIAKFESEEFLRGQIEKNVPITIFRFAMAVGETTTGKIRDFQSFYMMLEKMLVEPPLPVLPRGCPVYTTPLDILASGIVKLMEHSPAHGKVYHFSQGLDDRVSFADFLNNVQPIVERKLGRKINRPVYISPAAYTLLLRILSRITFGKARRKIDVALIFMKFMSLDWKIDNRQTRRTLESLGLVQPSFAEFLPRLLDYYFDHRDANRLPF